MFSIIIVSYTCRCTQCSRRLGKLVALLGYPSTRKLIDVSFLGNSTWYYFGVGGGNDVGKVTERPERTFCV